MSKAKKLKRRMMSKSTAVPVQALQPSILACRFVMILCLLILMYVILVPLNANLRVELFSIAFLLLAVVYLCAHLARAKDDQLKALNDKRIKLMDNYDRLLQMRENLLVEAKNSPNTLVIEQAALMTEMEELAILRDRLEASELQQQKIQEARKARMIEMAESRWRALIELEKVELAELESEVRSQIEIKKEALLKLEEGQELDLASELAEQQRESIEKFLQEHKIEDSPIIGISDFDKSKLKSFGLSTALDLDEKVLRSLGMEEAKTKAIFRWRKYLQQQSEIQKPTILVASLRQKIRKRYEMPRQKLEAEIDVFNTRLRRETLEINALYEIARTRLIAIEKDLAQGNLSIAESETQFAKQLRQVENKNKSALDKLRQIQAKATQREKKNQTELQRVERKLEQLKSEIEKITMPSRFAYFRFAIGIGKRDWLAVL